MQFKAGYILDSIDSFLQEHIRQLGNDEMANQVTLQVDGLLSHLSSFEVDFPETHELDYANLHPILSVLNNIITRGLPTKAPIILEEAFNTIGLTEKSDSLFELQFNKSTQPLDFQTIFELLHVLEPGLTIDWKHYAGLVENQSEWDFIDKKLQDFPFAKQILETQRDFSTISDQLQGGRRVDFSFEFPYEVKLGPNPNLNAFKRQGVIFEFDGPLHTLKTVNYYDRYRDAVAEEENFETLRQSYEELTTNAAIEDRFRNQIFRIFKKNFERSLAEFLSEYSLIYTPFAVARIQKTLIEYLLCHRELLSKKVINIAIIERDFPCAAIAIQGIQEMAAHLLELTNEPRKLAFPLFNLTVFPNPNYSLNNKLHLGAKLSSEKDFAKENYDIIIDHSILRRSKTYIEDTCWAEQAVKIRSSHYVDNRPASSRKVYSADLIKYKKLVNRNDDASYSPIPELQSSINFFIQNIYRKTEFREGQLPIISRALQQRPVIGLLPTGAGKSITYQLSALLQPGVCLVVDPIKSLMEDQVRVLKFNRIDTGAYINSNLSRIDKVKRLIDFRYSETMFLFVSPERLVMDDFRSIIKSLYSQKFKTAFSYCVIDEVHCVSEWGHDFRSTYLMLGKNAQNFAVTKNGKPVSLLGLTATASFDVLADIERELQIRHDDVANAIITIENTVRPELFFRVIDTTHKDRLHTLIADFESIGNNIQKLNDQDIIEQSKLHHNANFDEKELFKNDMLLRNSDGIVLDQSEFSADNYYTLIFCPVKGRNGHVLGVDSVFEALPSISKGFFYASDRDEDNLDSTVQKHFLDFVSDKTNHMVCTKAFGMGIDKKDIRSTYHFLYSGSLESLVQEAGRAGRDKKISEANILVSLDYKVTLNVHALFFENEQHPLLRSIFNRKAIRQKFLQQWNAVERRFDKIIFADTETLLKEIDMTDFSLVNIAGTRYNVLKPEITLELRELLKSKNDEGAFKYIQTNFVDRDLHEYFYNNAFRGIDSERSQFLNLFMDREFSRERDEVIYIEGQDTLQNEFENCEDGVFQFILTATKTYPNPELEICSILNHDAQKQAPYSNRIIGEVIIGQLQYSFSFNDFLMSLEESNLVNLGNLTIENRTRLLFIYSRNRSQKNDTGRLIYRMHSMGLLEDYRIDYLHNNLFLCTFRKHVKIDKYLKSILAYLNRYLSEVESNKRIEQLKLRLTADKLIDQIIECLYFLSEFAYKEIASKRKRATDEIESIMNTAISEKRYINDWYKQNLYIKEEIYYYFNAKYARIGFKITGQPYSLLEDHRDDSFDKVKLLKKYLAVFPLEGAAQNNYKHMIGSTKKILRAMPDSSLAIEWVLYLLKSFSMYAVNNQSYLSEANHDMEKGFENLYDDFDFHDNDYQIIEQVCKSFFDVLYMNINASHPAFKSIEIIRLKVLFKLQNMRLDQLLTIGKTINN